MEIAGDLVLDKYLLDRCNRTMWATIFDMMRLGWIFFDMFGFVMWQWWFFCGFFVGGFKCLQARRHGVFFPGVPCCTGVGMCTDLDSMSVVCVKDNRMR
jgi:hypothetical protein